MADDPEYETWNMVGGGVAPGSGDSGGMLLRGGMGGVGGAYDDVDASANPSSLRFMNPATIGHRTGTAGVGAPGTAMSSGHERRQTLLFLLDARVRRRMARTVLEMGGNAVLGYYQNFDMEGDSGIVRNLGWMP